MNKPFLAAAGLSLLAVASSNAATVNQIANDTSSTAWSTKSAPWGQVPIAANDYVTTPGLQADTDSGFGANYSARIRDTGSVFPGNSLTISGDTEALLKGGNNTISTGNIILNGGIIAYGVAGANTVGLAGNLAVPNTGILGMGGQNTLNVASTLTGSGTLSLRASDTSPTIEFTGNLSGFNGTFQIGGGSAGDTGYVTVNFAQAYDVSAAITMGTASLNTLDVLDLSNPLTVNSFEFGTTSLAAGTYTSSQLDGLMGDGSQFTGPSTLTVVGTPEPSSAVLLGSFGALWLLLRRRAIRRAM